MAYDDYAAVDVASPDDEEKRKYAMPAPLPPGSGLTQMPLATPSLRAAYAPDLATRASMIAPASEYTGAGDSRSAESADAATQSLAPEKKPTLSEAMQGTLAADPQPKWKDYAPAEKHGLAKVGSYLAAATAPFVPGVNEMVNVRPERRAEQQYEAADTDWTARRANELTVAELQQKPEIAEETGELRGANAANVARIAAGSREAVANTTQTGANTREAGREKTQKEIEDEKADTAKQIAKDREASQERIAKARDLNSKEVAKIRGELANDPNKLTVTMKTMKQQAQATLPQISKAMDETEKVASLLGPAEGRWNKFLQGEIGAPDPAFAHYTDEIHMVSTAVTLAHARGRMSNELFESFQKMFDAGKQSPENMMQALSVAQEWLEGYAQMGEPGSPVGNNTPAATGGSKIPTFAEHQAAKKKP